MRQFRKVYQALLRRHGPQGWWPIVNPKTMQSEYGLGVPRGEEDFFEVAIGALLAQNVSWKNAAEALGNIKRARLLAPGKLLKVEHEKLAELIRPARYFNQKTKSIGHFVRWWRENVPSFQALAEADLAGLRTRLLAVNGIGRETADSMLLYGLGRKIFVIDIYTRRLLASLGLITGTESYDEIQQLFHRHFRGSVEEHKEFHALIVAHAQVSCRKSPVCDGCCLARLCARSRVQ